MIERTEGIAHEAKGTLQEGIGKVTHDRSQQIEGKAEKHFGKAEQIMALMADRMRQNDARR